MSRGWTVALIALTVVAYLPAFEADFVWDDDDNVTGNDALASPSGLATIWTEPGNVPPWYPLAHSALWLQYRLWGTAPAGYHAVNVLLHVLNVLLVWTLLRRLKVPGSWLAAALFALHPVQVESVAWITEQKTLLSTTFALGAALAWLRFRPALTDPTSNDNRFEWRAWLLAALLFVLALLTKTVTVGLPIVLLIVTWWKLGRVSRRDVLAAIPLLVAAAFMGGLTAWLERHAVGASGPEWDRSLVERSLVAGRALWFYAVKFVWPWPVTYVYPRFVVSTSSLADYVAPLAALGLPVVLWSLRDRLGRGPLAAVACFGVVVAPALGFLDIYYMRYTFVADRWLYQACIAPFALLAAVAVTIAARRIAHPAASRVIAAGVLAAFATTTWTHARAFHDERTLWRDTLAKNPDAIVAHNNLGSLLLIEGDLEGATQHFTQAIAIDDTWPETHNNLGAARFRSGDVLAAEREHRRAIELRPDFADAHNNLGIALATLNRADEGLEHFRQAVALQPGMANARYNLGIALLFGNAPPEAAVEHLAESARIAPNDPDTRAHLGLALARSDRYAAAAAQYRTALELQPGSPETIGRLAWVLATCGDPDVRDGGAAVALVEPLALAQNDGSPALEVLAAAYAEDGRFAEAIRSVTRASSGRQAPAVAERLNAQLAAYRGQRPWRTPSDCPPCWP